MTVYALFIRESTADNAAHGKYVELARAARDGHPLTVLSSVPHETWEGEPADAIVLLQFPSMDAAKTWYESPAYQAAREHRLRSGCYRVFVMDAPPAC